MSEENGGVPREERGMVSRVGPLAVDWPRSVGYFGGIALAVAFEIIEPPVALFIAAIPFLKMLKDPRAPAPLRFTTGVLEGAAKPVGGDSQGVVRLATADTPRTSRARPDRVVRRAAKGAAGQTGSTSS